jgi:hypothetical protein
MTTDGLWTASRCRCDVEFDCADAADRSFPPVAVRRCDTTAGVPVVMSVPGLCVVTLDRKRVNSRTPLIMSAMCACIIVCLFCCASICRSCDSAISSRVMEHGPAPRNVSKPLRRLRVLCRRPHGSPTLLSQHIT